MRLRQESGRFLAQSHKKFEIAPELITNDEDQLTHSIMQILSEKGPLA